MRKAEAEQVLGKARGGVYCWQERLEREGLLGLEDRKWRPKRVCRPIWFEEQVGAGRRSRASHPQLGRETMVMLVRGTCFYLPARPGGSGHGGRSAAIPSS
jgi:hypothetical protein